MKTTVVIAFLALAGVAGAAEPIVQRNLPYAEPPNERQSLDVYTAAGAKDRPVAIWIHGGGWQRGDKSGVLAKPAAFVEKGFVFVAINYRFIPVVTMKDIASDVAKAIRWVHDKVAQYGGDPNTLFVLGHSAGAQLAALVCIDDRYLKAEGLALSAIKGCVPVDGDSYYPALQIDMSEPRRAASYRLKFPEGNDRELSSVTHIARDKGIPPFMILHVADFPESGTALQSQIVVKYLTDAKVPAEAVPVPGKTHVTLDADLGQAGDMATRAMFEFLQRQLKSTRGQASGS